MTTKERLHQLVDRLPDSETENAERLLEQLATTENANGLTGEDWAWLDADLSRRAEIEPYDWGPDGPPDVKPVRYVVGVGFVVEGRDVDQ